MPDRQPRPCIGLALSGGTLKAAAHIGVLGALRELGIHPDFVAGTSAGSFVAALYAHGYARDELQRLVDHFPGPRLFDYGFPVLAAFYNLARLRVQSLLHGQKVNPRVSGLLRGKQLEAYFRSRFRDRTATLPFAIVATDLYTGKPVVFTNDEGLIIKGRAHPLEDIARALCGSCALPGVLTPVSMKEWLLADGALRHYVPVEILRQAGCNKIIVVNLSKLESDWEPTTVVQVVTRSFDILLKETMADDLKGDDVFVLEPNVGHVTWVSFHELKTCLQAGKAIVDAEKRNLGNFLSPGPPIQGPTIKIRPLG